jgi:hypothetical protein
MKLKKIIATLVLSSSILITLPVFSAEMICNLNVKSGGHTWGNGTSNCSGLDMSFGNNTIGNYQIKETTKPVDHVVWVSPRNCSGLFCSVTVIAYDKNIGKAYIHYDDNTVEYVSAEINYETGF